jgi:hypothetical protein
MCAVVGCVVRIGTATRDERPSPPPSPLPPLGTCSGASSRLLISSSKVVAGTKQGSMLPSARFSTPATVWMFCLAIPKVVRVPHGAHSVASSGESAYKNVSVDTKLCSVGLSGSCARSTSSRSQSSWGTQCPRERTEVMQLQRPCRITLKP